MGQSLSSQEPAPDDHQYWRDQAQQHAQRRCCCVKALWSVWGLEDEIWRCAEGSICSSLRRPTNSTEGQRRMSSASRAKRRAGAPALRFSS